MSFDPDILHPAVRAGLDAHGIKCKTLVCDPELADTATFCEHYGFSPEQAANAIVVVGKTNPPKYVCCVVLATCRLDVNKTVSALIGTKRCSFATPDQTVEQTGMEIGGVTPIGLPAMPIYVDSQVMSQEQIVIGGGNRSSKLLLCPSELSKVECVEVVNKLGLPK